MVETVRATDEASVRAVARLLHDFNVEYDEPSPPVDALADRVAELLAEDAVIVLLARDTDEAVGFAVLRLQPSLYSTGQELYLAELYVVPPMRGHGFGRELISAVLDLGRARGADYAYLITTEEDRQATRLYEAAGFRDTEGEGGPLMRAYEREL